MVGQLCRIQRAHGHDVSVFAYSNLGVVGEGLRADGFEVYVPGVAPPYKTMLRYYQRLKAMKPDVVHTHNPAPTLQAALSARLAGVRSVMSTRHSLVAPPYDTAAEMKYSALATFCDRIVGICDITCENLRGAPLAHKSKIVRVYNGVPAMERVPRMAEADGKFVLLFVGRLAEVKNLETLIGAVAQAAPLVPELEFWVVGDGAVRASLEQLAVSLKIADRVRFWGQQVETAKYFSSADAFAMSSVSEGLPMSLLQAMSLGVPSLSTDVGGMAEVQRLSGSGLLTPVGDSAAMSESIVRLAQDAALRAEFSERARAAYATHFTLEQMHASVRGAVSKVTRQRSAQALWLTAVGVGDQIFQSGPRVKRKV